MSATTKTRLLAHDQEEADGAAHGHEKVDGELELRVVDGRVLYVFYIGFGVGEVKVGQSLRLTIFFKI